MELAPTIAVLAIEIAVFGFCFYQQKQPPQPGRVRLIPYNLVMLVTAVLILATLAHVVTLLTGEQLKPKNKLVR